MQGKHGLGPGGERKQTDDHGIGGSDRTKQSRDTTVWIVKVLMGLFQERESRCLALTQCEVRNCSHRAIAYQTQKFQNSHCAWAKHLHMPPGTGPITKAGGSTIVTSQGKGLMGDLKKCFQKIE